MPRGGVPFAPSEGARPSMGFIAAPPLELPGVEGPTGLLLSPHAASALHELSPLRGERSADVLPPSRAQKHQIISPWEGNRQSPREDLAASSPTLRHSRAGRAHKQNDCGSRGAGDVKQRGNSIKPPRGAGLSAKEEYAPQDTDKRQHDIIFFNDSHGEHTTSQSKKEMKRGTKEGGEAVPLAQKGSGLMATGRKRSPAQKREGHQQQREAQQQHRTRVEQTKMCGVDFKFTFDYAVRSEENTRQQLALISEQLGDEAVAQQRFLQQLQQNATGRKSRQRPETVSTRPTLGWKTTEQHDKGTEMSPLDVRRQPISASTFGSGITAQLHMSQLGSPSDSITKQVSFEPKPNVGSDRSPVLFAERKVQSTAGTEKRRHRPQQRGASEGVAREASMKYASEKGAFFDYQNKGRFGPETNLRQQRWKEERPALLHDCENHICNGLRQLDVEFGTVDGVVCVEDVEVRLRRQIGRAKVFELPLHCIIQNFGLVGATLHDIANEYEAAFQHLSAARQRTLKQVTQGSIVTDLEFRAIQAETDQRTARLRQSTFAWHQVTAMYDRAVAELIEQKAAVDEELRKETRTYLQKESLMEQLQSDHERLAAQHGSLKDVRTNYQKLEQQLADVNQKHCDTVAAHADQDLRLAALRQQIKHKRQEIEMAHRMHNLVIWKVKQMKLQGSSAHAV